ncbi:hypothetical protein BKI52_07490 [marine bacterium AO1-C]|nr:hypothetical protein BKI52_07490 [marine bacterium AO1-C]
MKRFNYFQLIGIVLFIIVANAHLTQAATLYSRATGNWNLATTWSTTSSTGSSCGCVPRPGDLIIIAHTVEISSNIGDMDDGVNASFITIQSTGILSFVTAGQLNLSTGSVIELDTGGQINTDNTGNANDKINIGGTEAWRSRCNAGFTAPNCENVTGPTSICVVSSSPASGSSCPGISLPAGLLTLKGNFNPDTHFISLEWLTTEANHSVYTIMRSANGQDFEAIEVINGAASNLKVQNFTSLDKKPLDGINYYRIKQTTIEGATVSKTIAVNAQGNYTVSAYPNPGHGDFQVTLLGYQGNASIYVYNMLGVSVLSMKNLLIEGSQPIPLSLPVGSPKGTYLVNITMGNQTQTLKLLVN